MTCIFWGFQGIRVSSVFAAGWNMKMEPGHLRFVEKHSTDVVDIQQRFNF